MISISVLHLSLLGLYIIRCITKLRKRIHAAVNRFKATRMGYQMIQFTEIQQTLKKHGR